MCPFFQYRFDHGKNFDQFHFNDAFLYPRDVLMAWEQYRAMAVKLWGPSEPSTKGLV